MPYIGPSLYVSRAHASEIVYPHLRRVFCTRVVENVFEGSDQTRRNLVFSSILLLRALIDRLIIHFSSFVGSFLPTTELPALLFIALMVKKLAPITETTIKSVIFVIFACIGSDAGDCGGARVGRRLWSGFLFSLLSSILYFVVSLELVNGFRRFDSGIVTKSSFNKGVLADELATMPLL